MGQLSILSDLHNNIKYYYSYDLGGRVKNITDNNGNKITYSFDNAGNISKVETLIDGNTHSIEYIFDLSSGKYDKTETTTFTKDYIFEPGNLERLQSIKITSGSSTVNEITFGYDDVSIRNGSKSTRINTIYQDFKGDSSNNYQEIITYDDVGYITEIDANGNNILFSYDSFGQLIREDNEPYNLTYIYEYDSNGNRTRTNIYTCTTVLTEDLPAATEYEIYSYQSVGWKDILNTVQYYTNGTLNYTDTYNYDVNWNITGISTTDSSRENTTYSFEGRSLTSITSSSHTYSYKYNQSGIRTSKTIDGVTTTYYLQGGFVIQEKNGTTNIYFNYDVDGTLISMMYNSNEYFYVYNSLGDIIYLLDSSGNIAATYQYDSFGKILNLNNLTSIGQVNPYRYKGYRYDSETNLYYLMSRYYNPETGRFINADGLLKSNNSVLGHNMFVYTENNPVNYGDPTGYNECSLHQENSIMGVCGTSDGGSGTGILWWLAETLGGYTSHLTETPNIVIDTSITTIIIHSYTYTSATASAGYSRVGWTNTDLENTSSVAKDKITASYLRARTYRDKKERHHIIPSNFKARLGVIDLHILLENCGMTTEDPSNFVMLTSSMHRRMHTNLYYQNLYNRAVFLGISSKTEMQTFLRSEAFTLTMMDELLQYMR